MKHISAAELKAKLASGSCQVVDVREPAEHETERLDGSVLVPLSVLDEAHGAVDKSRTAFLLCRSGNRAGKAAEKLSALGYSDLCVIEGGIEALKKAGHPIVAGTRKVWSMERQVRFAAGAMVMTACALGYFLHPGFYAAAAAVGFGLAFSAVTDTCTMALVLAKLPWNRSCGGSCS